MIFFSSLNVILNSLKIRSFVKVTTKRQTVVILHDRKNEGVYPPMYSEYTEGS